MIDLKTYNRLKAAVDEKQNEAQRAEGAFTQVLEQLKSDFDCSTVEEAKALLTKLEAKEEAAKAAFESKLKEFQEEWGHLIPIR